MCPKTINRLSPTSNTIKKLLLRSGNRCAFPSCQEVIFTDNDELVAECCHIEAALPGGERFNPAHTNEERRSYENLLFLCHKHHVETNNEVYTVEILKEIKHKHESSFQENAVTVNDKHVDQVQHFFEELEKKIDTTLATVTLVGDKQDEILNILKSKNFGDQSEVQFSEYFGIPQVLGFSGRTTELNQLTHAYNNNNVFIVEGISGIGKTTMIAYFLSTQDSVKTLWIDCDIVQSKEVFYSNLGRFFKQEFNDASFEVALSKMNDDVIQNSLLYSLSKNKCCVVFDGLNGYKHELISLLKIFSSYLSNSKIFISANTAIDTVSWTNPAFKLALSGLDRAAFAVLLERYFTANEVAEFGTVLFNLMNGHPYLLKIIASATSYKPIGQFVLELQNNKTNAIDDYIKQKAIESLQSEEQLLLKVLSSFIVPFRYGIGDFVLPDNFESYFRALRNKFLIEKYQDKFFIVPEFIRLYVLKSPIPIQSQNSAKHFVKYLQSIKDDVRFFEREAIIYHALQAQEIDIAKDEAYRFMSTLMGNGEFYLANKICVKLQDDPILRKWSWPYYVQGRTLRFQGNYSEALSKYNVGLELDSNGAASDSFRFEKASMLTYLSESLDDELFREAAAIYTELSKSSNANLAIQSQLS
ncbi:ATP-binding protein [Pseudoflavitalea rhizosphaerae]|uniref:ATP-binding protein n=1 Tax=Pseudoflavitalea rhizosphaerae TaxID=1884793 RepID=UPI000F8F4771|nr:ATP-binding protein [Pseudoflavitalea rhizosphaerae]